MLRIDGGRPYISQLEQRIGIARVIQVGACFTITLPTNMR